MSQDRYYLVKNGKPTCTIVYSGDPFPMGLYKETKSPEPVKNISETHHNHLGSFWYTIYLKCNVWIDCVPEDQAGPGPKVYFGRIFSIDNSALLGEATSYQYALKVDGDDLHVLARTHDGYVEAIDKLSSFVTYSDDLKDVWIPGEAFGIYDRSLPEVNHVFPEFTISYYGSPYYNHPLDHEATFNGIVAFGTDEASIACKTIDDEKYVQDMRNLIERLYAKGVKTRLYGAGAANESIYGYGKHVYDPLVDTVQADVDDAWIKRFVETFGDLEGISIWGFADEPGPDGFNYCAHIKNCFKKYDQKKRPVYINMGPSAHTLRVYTFYDEFFKRVRPDYLTYDRYPFFITERGAEMTDPYFYSNFELQRNAAIDHSLDHGVILTGMKVGGEPDSDIAEITPHFMRWQTNLLAAYGARYIEYYVYYHVHDYSILDEDNNPTWRWTLCVETTKYLKAIFSLLDNLRLDAVFHLENSDGGYDVDVTPYHGYRGVGKVIGNDAILSFYDKGVLVVTDKHADEFDGGDHDIILTEFNAKEWFNPDTRVWENIENCPAAKIGDAGLTIHFTLASQYIFR